MMKKKVTRWYISNGTCSWFNNLYVKSQVFYGPEENSWDNSIWFDDEQKANNFKEELQNFINERYFNNRKK